MPLYKFSTIWYNIDIKAREVIYVSQSSLYRSASAYNNERNRQRRRACDSENNKFLYGCRQKTAWLKPALIVLISHTDCATAIISIFFWARNSMGIWALSARRK